MSTISITLVSDVKTGPAAYRRSFVEQDTVGHVDGGNQVVAGLLVTAFDDCAQPLSYRK